MLDRKSSYSLKQNTHDDNDNKNTWDSSDPRIRVLQYDLVFVNGLPSNISSKEMLIKDIYFGRYGRVMKSILNPPYPFKKGVSYQVYVTYESELDASLAVVALDGLNLGERPLKVSYGTTKYCSYFLKGRQCVNTQCFYLHHIQKQQQVINGDTRTIFRQQNQRAIECVLNKLQQVVERILDSKVEGLEEGFPSLTETMEFLIDNGYLGQGEYEAVVGEVKRRRELALRRKEQVKRAQVETESIQKQKQQAPQIEDVPKLAKSSSFSTLASPSKPQATSTQYDDELQRVSEIDQKYQPKTSQLLFPFQQPQIRTARSQDENNKSWQVSLDFDEKFEQKISQKIIKQIMKKKNVKSRFGFVRVDVGDGQVVEEIRKVKNIIQRFLITYQ